MKTKAFIFSLFFVLTLLSGIIFIQKADATSYYNWLQNPSFVTYSDWCEDGGFESGENLTGLIYGNWTGTGNYSLANPHSGVYSYFMTYSETATYNLTGEYNDVLGADIIELSFWIYASLQFYDTYIEIYYSDSSHDTGTIAPTSQEWLQYDATSTINDAKYVDYIVFRHEYNSHKTIDDVVLLVDDGEGQDSIGLGTSPWQCHDFRTEYNTLNETFGRLDNNSAQYDQAYKLCQILNFLDTDLIHFVSGYVYGLSSSEGVKCILKYSDGSEDSITKYGSGDGESWTYINFGNSFIDSDKYLRTVYFERGTTDALFNIDDVGVWVTVPYGYSRFDFSLTPLPISKTLAHFECYMETDYTFFGFVYNQTDNGLNENGTYTFTDSFGGHSGNLINGIFNITLNQRTGNVRRVENVTVLIRITSTDEIIFFEIVSYWNPLSSETDIDITDSDVTGDFLANWFIYAIFLLVIPLSITVYVGGNVNPNPMLMLVTFLSSETLMTAISLSIGLVDLWFMLVIIIVDIMIILGLMKSGRAN